MSNLKTTRAELENAPDRARVDDVLYERMKHDALIAHELLERVAFLERVAEQLFRLLPDVGVFNIAGDTSNWVMDELPEPVLILSEHNPDLAQYLREREVEK